MPTRFIPNNIEPPDPQELHQVVQATIPKWWPKCRNRSRGLDLYTGKLGSCFALLRLHENPAISCCERKNSDDQSQICPLLQEGIDVLNETADSVSKLRKRATLLCGILGNAALRSIYAHICLHDQGLLETSLQTFVDYHHTVLEMKENEVLYGRAGFLQAILLIRRYIGIGKIPNEDGIIRSVIDKIFQDGLAHTGSDAPLMWEWHGKMYLGAAHGVFGILNTLLTLSSYLTDQELESIKATLDWLASTQRFSSGNYRSSVGSQKDRLVHWCHGSTGAVMCFTKAFRVFNELKWLELAQEAAEVVWERGILRKGIGLCHGISGSGYVFLSLYRIFQQLASSRDKPDQDDSKVDLKDHHTQRVEFAEKADQYLTRAQCFAVPVLNFSRLTEEGQLDVPDRKYSLFEGTFGGVSFLADLLSPDSSSFPAFEYDDF